MYTWDAGKIVVAAAQAQANTIKDEAEKNNLLEAIHTLTAAKYIEKGEKAFLFFPDFVQLGRDEIKSLWGAGATQMMDKDAKGNYTKATYGRKWMADLSDEEATARMKQFAAA